LITSAPMQARIIVAKGPALCSVKSRMRTPSRGGFMVSASDHSGGGELGQLLRREAELVLIDGAVVLAEAGRPLAEHGRRRREPERKGRGPDEPQLVVWNFLEESPLSLVLGLTDARRGVELAHRDPVLPRARQDLGDRAGTAPRPKLSVDLG